MFYMYSITVTTCTVVLYYFIPNKTILTLYKYDRGTFLFIEILHVNMVTLKQPSWVRWRVH